MRCSVKAVLIPLSVLILLAAAGYAFASRLQVVRSEFRLADSREQGAFNIGASTITVRRSAPSKSGREFLNLSYRIPPGTAAGFWSRAFPDSLRQGAADVVRMKVRAGQRESAGHVIAAVELKGTAGIQRIPLRLGPGWNAIEQPIGWNQIGRLNECIVSVTRVGGEKAAVGTLSFDLSLAALPPFRKLSLDPFARIAAVLLLGALGAGLAAFPGRTLQDTRSAIFAGRRGNRTRSTALLPHILKRDLVLGTSTVLMSTISLGIYHAGTQNSLDSGWGILGFAASGALLGEWIKYGLTGKHLSPAEAFRNVAVTGLLSASSSTLFILQAPSRWQDILLLNSLVAAAIALLYHAANLYRTATSGKHLGSISSGIIVSTPYLAGILLLLESAPLTGSLGGILSTGLLSRWPAVINTLGSLAVVWFFNEAAAYALAASARLKRPIDLKVHGMLLAAAAAAVAGPWIADLGSGSIAAVLPALGRWPVMILAAALSQASLWPEVYIITGMILDAMQRRPIRAGSSWEHSLQGLKKGMTFGAVFMGIVCACGLLSQSPRLVLLISGNPAIAATIAGALAFPLVKTLIETFDGTQGFFRRLLMSYGRLSLYFRGAVVGFGFGSCGGNELFRIVMPSRVVFGACVGLAASCGVSLLGDVLLSWTRRGEVQSWRAYAVSGTLGLLIGAGLGFYFDASQIELVLGKFQRYLSLGHAPEVSGMYALLSKWGYIQLGTVSGGVKLLYNESLTGVFSWGVPAWLFAINATLMSTCFRRETSPLAALFTREGLLNLGRNMIQVFRWGLWMAPIIASFIRPMADPTWYNQDGAIHTVVSAFRYITTSPQEFHAWSLGVFVSLLAFDSVRILIWLDHMGLRVATLVNLSFLGMDRLDARLARFVGPGGTAHCIPEGVKRFATWAPLLIPFYLPRGADWDFAWNRAASIQANTADWPARLFAMAPGNALMSIGIAAAGCTALFATARWARECRASSRPMQWKLANARYEIVLKQHGEMFSRSIEKGYDLTRRSYDRIDPSGRAMFVVDADCESGSAARQWPVLGHFPRGNSAGLQIGGRGDALEIKSEANEIRTAVEVSLGGTDSAEVWTIRMENLSHRRRTLKLAPYVEWVLNSPGSDRGHTQYNRLYPEMEYIAGLHAILAWHKQSKTMGFLAIDRPPEGFLTSRLDFIGRAQSIASPRVLQTLAFSAPENTGAHPTFDPVGSVLCGVDLNPGASAQIRVLIGMAESREEATRLIARHLASGSSGAFPSSGLREKGRPIGHGEILPGTPQPYYRYLENGRRLLVLTPLTTRPYDHVMSNALGHVMMVTNRGLDTTSNGNSQQNRLTPDWPDIVTREVPGEAFYLYDEESGDWYSPTYHPLNDSNAHHEVEFGVDGTATYRMKKGSLATELTAFVPVDDPAGVYLLTISNLADTARHIRLSPYFQMVLADNPENSGPLKTRFDCKGQILYFENPRNDFRKGPAFVAMSVQAELAETRRGRFFGAEPDVASPFFVREGAPDLKASQDNRPVAAFLARLEIPPHGQKQINVVLGQADTLRNAESIVAKYRDLQSAQRALAQTRKWWIELMDTVEVDGGSPDVNHYLDWLKYQTLAERIWARRGFYQSSGAYGFRDQLQDSVNLIWMDPVIARKQILLHAAHQFLEGDTVHWFHRLQDGRTGLAARTYASDNLLWLPWAMVEYVRLTGDISLLGERVSYLEAELPPVPLPGGKHGIGFTPLRSARSDSIYRHCTRAIDLVLKRRMGAHGLPLIGTGDWNDGLDEIGSKGKGESIWLGFFLYYILRHMRPLAESREGAAKKAFYMESAVRLERAIQATWRGDRYLRAIHDDGTEIGVRGTGVWEIDALTASWAVLSGIDPRRGRIVFDTAVAALERENTILLGWPPLNENTKPYLGRSSWYPEGVRENGMYCHGVQWLIGAARLLSTQCRSAGDLDAARNYAETANRLWRKISPLAHVAPGEIEIYGGQPNKQAADLVTSPDPGRMGWHGYTGAAGWLFRQALEGLFGLRLEANQIIRPSSGEITGGFEPVTVSRDLNRSPLNNKHERITPAPQD